MPATPGKSDRAAATPVTVAAVTLLPLDRTLPVVGTLFAKEEATIAARVEGQLKRHTWTWATA